MTNGELSFKDGSSIRGDYRITQLGPGLKSATFITTDFSNLFVKKEPDLLKSSSGAVVATGLVMSNYRMTGSSQTAIFEYIDRTS